MNGKYNEFLVYDNKIPENLMRIMKSDRDEALKLLYQQEPIEPKGKPYRCICHSLDFRFGEIIDLELSDSVSGRMIIAKSPYKNRFKKSYRDYNEFLMEWEELE